MYQNFGCHFLGQSLLLNTTTLNDISLHIYLCICTKFSTWYKPHFMSLFYGCVIGTVKLIAQVFHKGLPSYHHLITITLWWVFCTSMHVIVDAFDPLTNNFIIFIYDLILENRKYMHIRGFRETQITSIIGFLSLIVATYDLQQKCSRERAIIILICIATVWILRDVLIICSQICQCFSPPKNREVKHSPKISLPKFWN